MPEIEDLRQELSDLTRWRAGVVADAYAAINDANEHYDKAALTLHRRIKALEPPPVEETPTPARPAATRKRRPRVPRMTGTEGWSAEDIEHYRALQLQQV